MFKKVINIYSFNREVGSPALNTIFTTGIYAEVENGDIFEITGNGMNSQTLKQSHPNLG